MWHSVLSIAAIFFKGETPINEKGDFDLFRLGSTFCISSKKCHKYRVVHEKVRNKSYQILSRAKAKQSFIITLLSCKHHV